MTGPGPEAGAGGVPAAPCSVCDLVRGRPSQAGPVLHRDRVAVTYLARPGVVPGHTLVAPVRHAEAVVGDFALGDYLDLQRRVHEVGAAVAAVVPTGRLSVLSPGVEGGHVRWHVLPLPPGVPYADPLGLPDLSGLGLPGLAPGDEEALVAALRAALLR